MRWVASFALTWSSTARAPLFAHAEARPVADVDLVLVDLKLQVLERLQGSVSCVTDWRLAATSLAAGHVPMSGPNQAILAEAGPASCHRPRLDTSLRSC